MDNNFFSQDDLADLFLQLENIEDTSEATETEEEKASRKRYEDIIKKHKEN